MEFNSNKHGVFGSIVHIIRVSTPKIQCHMQLKHIDIICHQCVVGAAMWVVHSQSLQRPGVTRTTPAHITPIYIHMHSCPIYATIIKPSYLMWMSVNDLFVTIVLIRGLAAPYEGGACCHCVHLDTGHDAKYITTLDFNLKFYD